MKLNSNVNINQYLDFFIFEHKKVTEKIANFKSSGSIHDNNKLRHLKDRLEAAENVIANNFDLMDLVANDIYNMIWTDKSGNDLYSLERSNTDSELYKIDRDLSTKQLKHLREYGENELSNLVNFIVENDQAFYLLRNNLRVGN
jgi:hypothetical protein